jgi:DNA-binding winged helix-turn-helix (wHTH) protein/Tol biopolymer transport system component
VKTEFGPFVFDRAHQLLAREGQEVPLPPRVIGVLDVLTARPGQIVSKQELIETVWKDAFVSDTSLAEAISFLRQALGDDPQQPSYIQTVHRRGYRFLSAAPAVAPAATPAPVRSIDSWQLVLPWAIVVLLSAIAATALWRLAHPDEAVVPPVARFEVQTPAGTTLDAALPAVAVSADGSRIAFTACGSDGCQLFTRDLDENAPHAIAGTEGASAPFVSPDGTAIGFFADGRLKKIASSGGAPGALAEVRQPLGAVWSDDGTILFAATSSGGAGGLSRISASGGAVRPAGDVDARAGEIALAWPDVLPGGRVVLATALTTPGDPSRARIVAVSFATGQRTTVIDRAAFARFVPPSTMVFVRDGMLMAAAFDASQLKIAGQPVALGWRASDRAAQFAVSRVGTLVAAPFRSSASAELAWLSSDGKLAPLPATAQHLGFASLSADGRRFAALTRDDPRADVWSVDVERGAVTRLTFDGEHLAPVATPDARTVVFASRTAGVYNLFVRALDATAARRLTTSAHHQVPSSISPDGRIAAYTEIDPESGEDVWTVPLGGGAASPLVKTRFDESSASFSPDGRWIAYQSNESNRWEVYVRPFPGAAAAPIPISAGGGTLPVWSRDGRTLFYAGGAGVMAVDVRAECGSASEACDMSASRPREVARGPWLPRGAAPDGRLLVEAARAAEPADRLLVTLQWARELQRLVPPAVVSSPK